MTINKRISELLKDNYLSAEALAKKLGLSGPTVRKWRYNTALKLKHLLILAEYFNCSTDFLCGRTEDEGHFNKHFSADFSERLKSLIKNDKSSVVRISKETQLSHHNFYDWLNGKPPLSSSLTALADYFRCSVDYLIGISDY